MTGPAATLHRLAGAPAQDGCEDRAARCVVCAQPNARTAAYDGWQGATDTMHSLPMPDAPDRGGRTGRQTMTSTTRIYTVTIRQCYGSHEEREVRVRAADEG